MVDHLARDDEHALDIGGADWDITETIRRRTTLDAAAQHPELRSPMPGTAVAVSVVQGQTVQEGEAILIIEAMNMEHVLRAPTAGTVSVTVDVGAHVRRDEVVAVVPAAPAPADAPVVTSDV